MSSSISQLDFLKKYSVIDCDTLDVNVKELGPFINCTSNQIIAYLEVSKPENHDIIVKGAELARDHEADEEKRVAYGVKALMVQLSLRMLPYISGRVLTQTTMYAAHNTEDTVKDALEIIEIYKKLSPGIDVDRICIKIPSTYEGLEACRILEAQGVGTLGTTLFCLEQAILAQEVGCHYISPYINELKVHLVPGAVDEHKAFLVIKDIFEYYESHQVKTQIMAASVISSEEVLQVSGVHHMTISPGILRELSQNTIPANTQPVLNAAEARKADVPSRNFLGNEAAFKSALSENVEAFRKVNEAIEWFMKFEKDLEELIRVALKDTKQVH